MDQRRIKRSFDFWVALLLLPFALPLCLLFALIHLLLEREAPIFTQKRVGLNQEHFTIYKLRTMRASTASVGTHELDSSVVSNFGHLLRKSKLDELPQLINVIKGDMSLVGPRPCLVTQTQLIEERVKLNVFNIRPGITGLSQVTGIDMSEPTTLAIFDAKYISKMSLKLDVRIIMLTLCGSGTGDRLSNRNRNTDCSNVTRTKKALQREK